MWATLVWAFHPSCMSTGVSYFGMGFPSFLYVSGSVGYFGMGFPSFLYVSTGVGYCGMGFPSLQVSNNNNR